MNDLVTWLRRQLDEDEEVALATNAEVLDWIAGDVSDNGEPHCGAYIRRWGRDRALDEVATKRAILDLHADIPGDGINYTMAEQYRAEEVLKHLAQPYADRPGYLEEWRP